MRVKAAGDWETIWSCGCAGYGFLAFSDKAGASVGDLVWKDYACVISEKHW